MAYSVDEAKELVVEAGLRLVREGLIARTWGNISARVSADEFVITPSGRAYEDLTPADIVTVRVADASWEGDVKPSSEKGVHAAVYRVRPEVDFVIHTHQTFATAYGTLGLSLSDYGDDEWRDLGDFVPCGAYAISSTASLARNMEEVVRDCPDSKAFFMRNHGVLAVGAGVDEAFAAAETLERVCERVVREALAGDGVELAGSPAHVLADRELTPVVPWGDGVVLFAQIPAIVEVSKSGKALRPVIDDAAQIAGPAVPVIEAVGDWEKCLPAPLALGGGAAVLLRGVGALCFGLTVEEAEAVALVLEKNATAQLFLESQGQKYRLALPDALVQRAVYAAKYSKLKG